jgi:uncharacterized membrane protein
MPGLLLLVLFVFLGLFFAAPLIMWRRLLDLREKLGDLEARLRRLEGPAGAGAPPDAAPAPFAPPAPPATVLPAAVAPPAPGDWVTRVEPAADPSTRSLEPSPAAAVPAALPVPPPPVAAAPPSSRSLEDTIGGTWMQNLGAVVLLLGTFLFILWGYSTGRIGPGVLVATGILLGLVSILWGDRLARSLPRLGHTFIGVGIGAVYLSLYLGHFTLQLLSRPVALVLLLLTSLGAFAAGLRYRVAGIAAFGVVGAFIPQLFSSWFSIRGFTLEPMALLGYLAIVDVLVFALAARAGWSGLDLAALLLTTLTWLTATSPGTGSWPLAIGLGVLYTALGFAPLPPLVRAEGRVRPLDLAVVACAPLALALTTWPWLSGAPRALAAGYLFALAALQLAAAAWVDARRPERDLWRPLTGAAVVFLTLGAQRLAGETYLALVWAFEGVLLVLLGLAPRSGWLRLCGHVVTGLAFLEALGTLGRRLAFAPDADALPFLHADALRGLGFIALLLAGAFALARARDRLAPLERWAPEAWTLAGNLLLLPWTWARCDELARVLQRLALEAATRPIGTWDLPSRGALFVALLGAAWFAHALVLVWRGTHAGRGFLRAGGYAMTALAVLVASIALGQPGARRLGGLPVVSSDGLVHVASLVLGIVLVARLVRERATLAAAERRAPEVVAAGFLLVTLLWSSHEANRLARLLLEGSMPSSSGRNLAAALTSGAWLVEAILLLALGWRRTSPFLRWAGLVVLGVTLLKFMIHDLANADVFWRFLTAIAAGAAMLAVSFAYQRRLKARRAGEPPPG